MYHSKTPETLKEIILQDFVKEDTQNYYILIATSALGIGVNIPNVRRIYHLGTPSDFESYV